MSDLDEMLAIDLSNRLQQNNKTTKQQNSRTKQNERIEQNEVRQKNHETNSENETGTSLKNGTQVRNVGPTSIACDFPATHTGLVYLDCYGRWICLACTKKTIPPEATIRKMWDRKTETMVWPIDYRVGDAVTARRDIWHDADQYGPRELVAAKGERLIVKMGSPNSGNWSVYVARDGIDEMIGVQLHEIE